MSKTLKVIGGILATIILGAIGSGIWEKMLSPSLSYLSDKTILLVTTISSTYSDTIYKSAASLEDDANLNSANWLFLLIASILLFIYFLRKNRENPAIDSFYKRHSKMLKGWPSVIASSALVLSIWFGQSIDTEVYKIRSAALENLEIIRPHTSNNVYLELRSQFLQVKTRESFELFKDKVENIAKNNAVTLEVYGR